MAETTKAETPGPRNGEAAGGGVVMCGTQMCEPELGLSIDGAMFATLSTAEKLALHRVLNSAGVTTLRCTRAPAFTGLHGELQAVRWPLRHELITELPHRMYAGAGETDIYAPHGITELSRRQAIGEAEGRAGR